MVEKNKVAILDTGKRPKVSVVLGVRNEYPVILGTINAFVEELEFWGYPYEIIVVDNLSTDSTADILEDKYRRWVRSGLLKVIRYNEKPANVTVRNIGVREASGEVVFMGDGHLSVKIGTCHGMIQGWLEKGGLWHSAINIWGDTSDIKCYGYDLKLEERFWGNLSRGVPAEVAIDPGERMRVPKVPFYRVPMASHCCLMAGREEFLDFRGYCEKFRCYGGGEPFLDLKWWLFGSEVYLYAYGLIRHAFGVEARWETASKDKRVRNYVHKRDGTKSADLKEGDEFLRYSRGYSWTNEQFQFNFMLSAYTIGGYEWLQQRYECYYEGRKGNPRYVEDLQALRREVLFDGAEDRKFIASRQKLSLNELLVKKPWENFDGLGL